MLTRGEWDVRKGSDTLTGPTKIKTGVRQIDEGKRLLKKEFEARVRHVRCSGVLLSFPLAQYLAGFSRARLRHLISTGRVFVVTVDTRPYVDFVSLVSYRRRSFAKRLSASGTSARSS
jgi:hypothetical protein